MSDKELIKQEIESYKESMKSLWPHSDFRRGQITAYNHILQFIDSLPEENHFEDKSEMVSEDLEEELHNWMKENCDDNGFFNQLELARHFAEWQKKKDQETIELAEDHAMLAGMNRMKEEMMGNAVECTWGSQATSSFMSDFPNIECGDKVKIIICKTEQQ